MHKHRHSLHEWTMVEGMMQLLVLSLMRSSGIRKLEHSNLSLGLVITLTWKINFGNNLANKNRYKCEKKINQRAFQHNMTNAPTAHFLRGKIRFAIRFVCIRQIFRA